MFKKYLTQLKCSFDFIDTDYKFFKYIEGLGIFNEPIILTLEQNELKKSAIEECCKSCLVLSPIEFQIKSFFQTENILCKTLEYTRKLEQSDELVHFVNGNVYKKIKAKYNQSEEVSYVIPLWVYADEFEVNDPQSSHSKVDSICGI